jgi:hypothetical protein
LPPRFLAWASQFRPLDEYYSRARQQLDVWTAGHDSIPLSHVILRTGASVNSVRFFLGLALALAAAGIVYLVWHAVRMVGDWKKAPPIARLRRSVRAREGIPTLIAAIDKQLARIDPKYNLMDDFILSGWLVSVQSRWFDLMSADDIVWIAPFTKTTRVYYVIPVWRQHLVKVFDRHRRAVTLKVHRDDVTDTMKRVHQIAPWAIASNDARVYRMFRKRKSRERAALIQAVDNRRQEIRAIWAENAKQRAETW